MKFKPTNLEELRAQLSRANATGGRVESVDLSALARIRGHTPEDMTVTVEAGMTVSALQAELGKAGQWLPVDPPDPGQVTIGGLLNENLSGPRRFGYGTIREHIIGIGVVLADGRLIHAGGKVVKNVAGYDLCKLFVGARGTLGVIVEATFKLRPLPEVEAFVQVDCDSLDEAGRRIERVLDSPLTPVVLDLHGPPFAIVLGFAGTRAEVEWQLARAAEEGIARNVDLEYERTFWAAAGVPRKVSVAASNLIETIRRLGDVPFVSRAGNGVIHYRGSTETPKVELPIQLFRRLKEAYDPKHILPELTA